MKVEQNGLPYVGLQGLKIGLAYIRDVYKFESMSAGYSSKGKR